MTSPTLKEVVAFIIEVEDRDTDRVGEAIAAVQADGYRVVNAGQVGDYDPETGLTDWQVTDYYTGEVLASGRDSGPEGMDAAWQDGWYCVDSIEVEFEDIDYPDVPDGLFVAMREEIAMDIDAYRAWVAGQDEEPS